jgi:adenosylcobinamide-GDP ribazoletransferase
VRPFFAALSFLTPLRVPASWAGGEQELRWSVYYFPIVGLVIGGVAAAACFGLDHVLPPLATSVIVVVMLIASSRGLHTDGLADTADGLLSSRPREQMLEIMRDSRTGAMGTIAVVCVVLAKTLLLASVVPDGSRWRLVLLTPLAGRCAMVVVMAALRYARAEGGLATAFVLGGVHRRLLLLWAPVAALGAGWLLAMSQGLVAAAAALVAGLLVGLYCHRKIGGYTGDTLGATNELVECVPALVGALWAGAA